MQGEYGMHKTGEMPKVTIVSAVWNLYNEDRVEFFEQMMETVHNQTYSNIEHLIVYTNSTDRTADLIDKYVQKGWARVVLEPKRNVWHAMNKGIEAATGEFINFMNSDDFFSTEHAVELIMKKIVKSGAKWGYGAADLIDKKTGCVVDERNGKLPAVLFASGCPCHQAVFTSADELRKRGGFDVSDPENPGVFSDNKIMIALVLEGYMPAVSSEKIVKYRMGGISDKPENRPKNEMLYAKSIYRMLGQKWDLSLSECKALYCCDCGAYNPDSAFLRGKTFAKNLGEKIQLEFTRKYYFDQLKKFERGYGVKKVKYLSFGFLSILKKKTWHENMSIFYFLGIPVLKYKQKLDDRAIRKYLRLFCLLPVWSKKEWRDRPKLRISLFGIPILKFKANEDYSERKWYMFGFMPIMKIEDNRMGSL